MNGWAKRLGGLVVLAILMILTAVLVFVLGRFPTLPPKPLTSLPVSSPRNTGSAPREMKIVYAETDGTAGTTTIWLASVSNIAQRKGLANITHQPGYEVRGQVSPDGSKIAYHVIPPGTSDRAARTAGGELWVMNSDGTGPHRVADQIGTFVTWSPDSTSLTYVRLVALQAPKSPQVPFRTELYRIGADGSNQRLLLADDSAYGIHPLGWSVDGQVFYYALVIVEGQWQIWSMDASGGSVQFQAALPSQALIESLSLSPDGSSLLLTEAQGGQRTLVQFSLDKKEFQTVAGGAAGDQPIDHTTAVWSPDSRHIAFHAPPQNGQPTDLQEIDTATGQSQMLPAQALKSGEFFLPQSWSPDGQWLAVLQYPKPQSLAYLLPALGGTPVQIPLTQPSHWVTLLGWTDR